MDKSRLFRLMKFCFLSLFTLLLNYSCQQKETSEIEKIIITDSFINSKIAGYDSFFTDSSMEYKWVQNTYYLKSDKKIIVGKDSLKRTTYYWLKDKNDKTIEGAELSPETGQILGKLNFDDGEIVDGEVKYYYPNGRVSSKGQLRNGRRSGKWKFYNENGELIKIEER